MSQQIILNNIQKPGKINLKEDITWLGDSFGYTCGRDTERINALILEFTLRNIAKEGYTSTEKISKELNLEVQRVNYHLKTLIESGLLYREKKLIYVRQGSVKCAVEEIKKDANRILDELIIVASDIDNKLGLKNR